MLFFIFVVVICLAGAPPVKAAELSTQDMDEIEQALKSALPTEANLAAGYEWKSTFYSASYDSIQENWDADPITGPKFSQWISVIINIRYQESWKTPEEFRSWVLSVSPWDKVAESLDLLPGAVITTSSQGDKDIGQSLGTTYMVYFWRSPEYWGYVICDLHTSCFHNCWQNHESASQFARSECERLAKLVYDRLPGGEDATTSEYSELISVLRKYRPVLFGTTLNPKLTDEIIAQALSNHEVAEGGREGATVALNINMLSEIDDFEKSLEAPIPSWDKPLITPQEKDDWDKTMDYYYNILDKAYQYIQFCDLYGYEYVFPIPPPLGPAEWIMTYKNFLDKAEYLRDSYYLPGISEDMYKRYKEKRSTLAPDEAFDETIYESQTTLDWMKGSGWYAVRAAPEFSGMDNSDVEKLLSQRFENRYNIEKIQEERENMVKYPEYYIGAIIHDYDGKMLLISGECDRILAEQEQE